MNTRYIYIVFCALLFGMASCAVTDFDRKADFSKYRSFAWGKSEIKVENPAYRSDLINKNIRNTVENEFSKRGITADKKDPDFIISYHTYTENKQETTGSNFYGPYGFGYPFAYGFYRFSPFGYFYPYPYMMGNSPRTYNYTEGTLIIDITDAHSQELIWRGSVTGRIGNTKDLEKQIAKGIKAIMKKYPGVPQQQPLDLDKKVIG
jgi:hypothetical protein